MSELLTFEDPEEDRHYKRLHAALFNTYDLRDVAKYIEEKTFLKGARFSFKDHEFQGDILSDTARDVNVQKCAQVGLSEGMARYALGVAAIMPYFSVIMTMPFKDDAANFAKTRMDPIIDESPDLKLKIDKDLDNSEIKGIGTSLLYMRGCNGTTAALSVPADMLIHDELDRSDPAIVEQFQSRIKHSRWKLTRKFGTPTLNKVGIALEMLSSKRHFHMCKCHHCNHSFVPSFHTDVIIPGFDGEKREINKYNIDQYDWMSAKLICPRCGREPSLQYEHREWVCENLNDNFDARGYYVSPFSVPNIVTIPSLVKEITKYKWGEFCNQALGETTSENDQQMIEDDLNITKHIGDLASTEIHCMGIDVGQICHITVGRLTAQGMLIVCHFEQCLLDALEQRKRELAVKYRCVITVIDSQPETYLVAQMQKKDKNLFGAQYHQNTKQAVYDIQMIENQPKKGKMPINLARIHRNLNFDELMGLFKLRLVRWSSQTDQKDKLFISHCLDMQRKQEFDSNNELTFVWQKTEAGQDHYMHALGYLHVACRLMPTASKNVPFSGFPLATRIKIASNSEVRAVNAMRR